MPKAALAKLLVGITLGLLVAEGVLRIVAGELAPDDGWHSPTAAARLAILEAKTETTTIFTGTSQVEQGLNPEVAGSSAGINMAVSSGTPTFQQLWLTEQVLARGENIDHVVWGLSALVDLDANVEESALNGYLTAPRTAHGLGAAVLRRAARFSYLVRYRQAAAGGQFSRITLDREPAPVRLTSYGFRTQFSQQITVEERVRWSERLAAYEFGGRQLQAFDDTVDALEQRGISITVVEMPVPPRLVELLPGGADHYLALRDQLRTQVAALGVNFVAYDQQFESDELFVDFTHFSSDGAARFSAAVGQSLADT